MSIRKMNPEEAQAMQDLAQINDEDIADSVDEIKTGDLYKVPASENPQPDDFETAIGAAGEKMKTGEMLEITEDDIIDPEHDSAMKTLDSINAELDRSQNEKDMIDETLSRLDRFNQDANEVADNEVARDKIDVADEGITDKEDGSVDVEFDDMTGKEDKRLVKYEQEAIRLEQQLAAKREELVEANLIKKFMVRMSISGLENRIAELKTKINRRKEIIEINRPNKKAA